MQLRAGKPHHIYKWLAHFFHLQRLSICHANRPTGLLQSFRPGGAAVGAMAAPVLALLEKDLDDWGSAVLVKASKELGRGAGQNTVYLVVNQQSGVYIMNEALQDPGNLGGMGTDEVGWDQAGKRRVSAEMIYQFDCPL